MIDYVGLLILLALVVLFGWLVTRAWRARNGFVKWAGVIVSGLLTILFALVLVAALKGTAMLSAKHNNPVSDVKVAMTPEQIARGERFAVLCADCHAADHQLPMEGSNFGANLPMPIGTLYAPNLTPAGELKDWTDGEIIRAIREGVHKNGRSLIIMPSDIMHNLSDDDVQALVAYLRSQPPVEPATPTNKLNVIGALFMNMAPLLTAQPPITGPVTAPPEGPTAAYGEYMVNVGGCRACHGTQLAGGTPPEGGAPAPNLTKIIPTWTEAQFITFFRTGQTPSGETVSDNMPWKSYNQALSDDNLKAAYAYLSKLTPMESSAAQ